MSQPVSAIVVCCSSRKTTTGNSYLSQSALRRGSQSSVAAQWLERLRRPTAPQLIAADTLYAGRGVVRGREIAESHGAGFYIVSAGLGFIRGASLVPSYDLTVSPTVSGAVPTLVDSPFGASDWWQSVMSGPYAIKPASLFKGEGRLLVVLSQQYARMVGPWLSTFPPKVRSRLRLLGAGLGYVLPDELSSQCIEYDERLDALVPGIRLNFAIRAFEHFVDLCAQTPISTVSDDQLRVAAALANVDTPARAKRPRMDDDDLVPFIEEALSMGGSLAHGLAHLRNELGLACSESRFKRLATGVYA